MLRDFPDPTDEDCAGHHRSSNPSAHIVVVAQYLATMRNLWSFRGQLPFVLSYEPYSHFGGLQRPWSMHLHFGKVKEKHSVVILLFSYFSIRQYLFTWYVGGMIILQQGFDLIFIFHLVEASNYSACFRIQRPPIKKVQVEVFYDFEIDWQTIRSCLPNIKWMTAQLSNVTLPSGFRLCDPIGVQ